MLTKILSIENPSAQTEGIKYAAELIKKGELVAFPTETVSGLGADAMNPEAEVSEKVMINNIQKFLEGQKIEKDFDPSIGCSIKWKEQQT